MSNNIIITNIIKKTPYLLRQPTLKEKANISTCIVSSLETVVNCKKIKITLLIQKVKSDLPILK